VGRRWRRGRRPPDEKGNLVVLQRGRPCSQRQVGTGELRAGINFERDSGIHSAWDPRSRCTSPSSGSASSTSIAKAPRKIPSSTASPPAFPHGPADEDRADGNRGHPAYRQRNTVPRDPDRRPSARPIKSQDTTWYGDAVGKWEGDTLVVDIVGFNDESWIAWPGGCTATTCTSSSASRETATR
jgi:hypothetical protein